MHFSVIFLLGLTSYDQYHDDWVSLAQRLQNPNRDEAVQLVIDALIFTQEKHPPRSILG